MPFDYRRTHKGRRRVGASCFERLGTQRLTGHTADFTADFKALANKASAYKIAKQAADRARKAKALAGKMGSQQNADYSQLDF